VTRLGRSIIAALVALLALVVVQWFDAGVLVDAQRRTAETFDTSSLLSLLPVAHLLTAAGVVAIVVVAWWSRSVFLAVGYAIVGGFLVFLPTLAQTFAISVNGAPPLAPEPIANALWQWFFTISEGLDGAVFTLGAAMFLSGLAVIGASLRRPRPAAAVGAISTPADQPSQSEPA
jgi:RsiW-degrading membrane proteinase PrsW (M82 family)